MRKTVVARWESRNGKYWVVLLKDDLGYTYQTVGGAGTVVAQSDEAALLRMEAKVRLGYFLPDSYKTAMRRVEKDA